MVGVKLCSAVYPQIMLNNTGKQFSTGMYDRKTEKVYNCYFPETILKQFW